MSENNDAIQILAQEITKTTKALIANVKADKTVKARVTARLSANSNKYLVMIDGSEYEAFSYNSLSVDDIVYATLIQGGYDQIMITMPIMKSNRSDTWELETRSINF